MGNLSLGMFIMRMAEVAVSGEPTEQTVIDLTQEFNITDEQLTMVMGAAFLFGNAIAKGVITAETAGMMMVKLKIADCYTQPNVG